MDVIGSLQLIHLERRAVPHNEQNLARASFQSESGAVPGIQHSGQNFNATSSETGIPLQTASRYSQGTSKAVAKPERIFWLSRVVFPRSILPILCR